MEYQKPHILSLFEGKQNVGAREISFDTEIHGDICTTDKASWRRKWLFSTKISFFTRIIQSDVWE